MLEILDLKLKLDKKQYKAAMDRLEIELTLLQRAIFENGIPVLILFEGWDGSGKGDSIGRLMENLDPRGARVHTTRPPDSEDVLLRPWLWRFWLRIPAKGEFRILDRSWYYTLTRRRLEKELDRAAWQLEVEEAKAFERQLVDDGVVLIKFWLQVSRKEQKQRIKAWKDDPYQQWRIKQPQAQNYRRYDEITEVIEDTLARTGIHGAPWTLVEADDHLYRRVKVMEETVATLKRALEARGITPPDPKALQAEAEAAAKKDPVVHHEDPLGTPPPMPADSPLAQADLTLTLEHDEYKRELKASQERMRELEFALYAKRRAAIMVFEGWDAAGKGGAIKRLTVRLDPRGYDVIPFSAPHGAEATHHYLWRFWRQIPKAGHIAIFDRSWYGRVLVERVEGFATEDAWRRAYQEINEFERVLHEDGAVILKFWLHISPEEQVRRFRARETNPMKRYKITDEDWRNRAKYPAYLAAVSEMLRRTSTAYAPWTVVEGDSKHYARVKVLRTAIEAVERVIRKKD